jgi:hypothetical protein
MIFFYEKQLKKENELMRMGYKIVSIWGGQFQPSEDIEINNIIKCNNKYRMISNGKYIFKDLIAYLAPETSLTKFLVAFDTKIPKGVFPHRVTQEIQKYLKEYPELITYQSNIIELLKHSPIPEKEWFFNDLQSQAVELDVYNKIKDTYLSLYNLLVEYNN